MRKYLPEKSFKIEIFGITLLIFLPTIGILISFFLLQPLTIAIKFNAFTILTIVIFYSLFISLTPYGIFLITGNGVERQRFGFNKKIRFDEITEIHQVEITSPHTYYGKYYIYVKSRDAKIKFCDRIQGYNDLIIDILNNCGKDSFEYREDTMNKYWIRKW